MRAALWIRVMVVALALLAVVPGTATAQIGAGCTLINFVQQGFAACPPGSVVTPLGLPVTPQGVVINPQGLILTPQGQLLTPQGQVVDLQGHDGSSHGQLVSCMARNTPPGPGHGRDMREVAREGEDADIADLTVPGAAAFAVCLAELNNAALTSTSVLPNVVPIVPNVVPNQGRGHDDDNDRGPGQGRGNRGGGHDNSGPGRGNGRGR
jgi:hypothetical protein